MPDPIAHYVKFARSLAMTSTLALQACAGAADAPADDPVPPTAPTSTTTSAAPATTTSAAIAATATGAGGAGSTGSVVADAGSPADPADASDADAGLSGHLSGPLPPPELPRSLALA